MDKQLGVGFSSLQAVPDAAAAPLLRALLEGAQLRLIDGLTRRSHGILPFWDPFAGRDLASSLPPLEALVVRLWCLGETLDPGEVASVLDGATLDELAEAGLVKCEGGVTSPWSVATYLHRHVLVTPPPGDARFDADAPVAYVGPESFFLARFLAQAGPFEQALDLCTGSGLLAGLLDARRVKAVEIDPFAAAVARFNVALNGMTNVEVVEGDLFSAVTGERFDFVCANPPFLPAPDGVRLPLCGDGGHDGSDVLRRLLASVGQHLGPFGRALIYGEDLGTLDEPNIVAWLRDEVDKAQRDFTVWIAQTQSLEAAALRLTLVWQLNGATEEDAWEAWRALTAPGLSTHHHSFLVHVTPGLGNVRVCGPFGS
jgi:methylase of polypeptide subunit release factors